MYEYRYHPFSQAVESRGVGECWSVYTVLAPSFRGAPNKLAAPQCRISSSIRPRSTWRAKMAANSYRLLLLLMRCALLLGVVDASIERSSRALPIRRHADSRIGRRMMSSTVRVSRRETRQESVSGHSSAARVLPEDVSQVRQCLFKPHRHVYEYDFLRSLAEAFL